MVTTIHDSYAIPNGTWRSSFQAEMKAIKKALQIIQTEESPQKFRIVSDSQLFLLVSQASSLQYPLSALTVSDIISHLAALHDEGHQITFTWCLGHSGVEGNEMTDEQALKGAATNQGEVRRNYDSAMATIRHTTIEVKISHERIHRVLGMKR